MNPYLTEVLNTPSNDLRGTRHPEGDYGFMPRQYAGRWMWNPVLSIVYFVVKGGQKPLDNTPAHYSILPTRDNTHKGALLRALTLEAKRIKRLDLPTESV